MKRKNRHGKMGYAELVEAGHTELAHHVMWQRNMALSFARKGIRGHMKKNILDPKQRFLRPCDLAP